MVNHGAVSSGTCEDMIYIITCTRKSPHCHDAAVHQLAVRSIDFHEPPVMVARDDLCLLLVSRQLCSLKPSASIYTRAHIPNELKHSAAHSAALAEGCPSGPDPLTLCVGGALCQADYINLRHPTS